MGHYCYLNADILTIVLQKCSLSSPLPNVLFLSKPLNLIGCPGNRKAKPHLPPPSQKKIIFSEAIRGIKLKLCRNVFYCCWSSAFIAIALKILHWLIMGKGKIGIYCHLTVDILIKVLQKCFLFSLPEPKAHKVSFSIPMVRRPSVVRHPSSSSTLSNLNISEASWPILIKFYV